MAASSTGTVTITADGTSEIFRIRKVDIIGQPYLVSVHCYGSFGGGTVAIKLSADNGTTKYDARDAGGSSVTFTVSDAKEFTHGVPRDTTEIIVYAVMSGATSPSVTVKAFDNF